MSWEDTSDDSASRTHIGIQATDGYTEGRVEHRCWPNEEENESKHGTYACEESFGVFSWTYILGY